MKLYLIRHAESANNASYASTGSERNRSADPPLTERGHRQAGLVADHLADPCAEPQHHPHLDGGDKDRGFGLTHLYCSLMTRSIATARYVARACQLPLVAHPDIFEKGGVYELRADGSRNGLPGPDRRYFAASFPDLRLPRTLGDGPWYDRPFETEAPFLQRVRAALEDIRRRHADTDDRVALVSHGDFMDQLINQLAGVERRPENYSNHWVANWAFHNTSITRVDLESGSRVIVYTNRLRHLPPELVTW